MIGFFNGVIMNKLLNLITNFSDPDLESEIVNFTVKICKSELSDLELSDLEFFALIGFLQLVKINYSLDYEDLQKKIDMAIHRIDMYVNY